MEFTRTYLVALQLLKFYYLESLITKLTLLITKIIPWEKLLMKFFDKRGRSESFLWLKLWAKR